MKLPDAIKCGAFVYRVRCKKRLVSDEQERLYGQARHGELAILLDRGMHPANQRETLLHEVIHAVANERHLDLPEECVNQLSHGLAAILIDNPDFTAIFLADANGGDH